MRIGRCVGHPELLKVKTEVQAGSSVTELQEGLMDILHCVTEHCEGFVE